MTTTVKEQLSTVGVVTDRNHKDGKKADGTVWNRYSFQINGHWYSSFADDVWKTLEKGKCFKVYYSEKENLKGGAPYRTVEWSEDVPMEPATAAMAQQAAEKASSENELRRSAAEMRWTEAINNATNMVAASLAATPEIRDACWDWQQGVEEAILRYAAWYYQAIIAGPPPEQGQVGATEAAAPQGAATPSETPAQAQEASFAALSAFNGAWKAALARNQWPSELKGLAAVEGFIARNYQDRKLRALSDAEVAQVTKAVREDRI